LGIEGEVEKENEEDEEREEAEGPGEVMEEYIVSRKNVKLSKREVNGAGDPETIEIVEEGS